MKQIKTISGSLSECDRFDKAVNAALEEGWELKRRDVIVPHGSDRVSSLYAELEKLAEEPPKAWLLKQAPNDTAPNDTRYACPVCNTVYAYFDRPVNHPNVCLSCGAYLPHVKEI